MPEILFFDSKSGELTCTVDGIALHSKYNPLQEASRFVQNINCDFIPQNIVITEPGIFYSLSFLKEKFPSAKIYSIHYSLETYNKTLSENKILADTEAKANNLKNSLYNLLGEEGLLSTLFLSWPASGNAFKHTDLIVWKEIKASIELSRTILTTRSHFCKKWFTNCIKNITAAKNKIMFSKNNKPVIVCASGPSLNNCMQELKKCRENFFLLAVSSAALPLIKNEIIPDAIISTDGGFWAKKHLEILRKHNNIPLILACEGNCPTEVLTSNPILLLTYPDGSASELVNTMGIPGIPGLRNGTVSGTAVDFAKKITTSSVFCFGLDLAPSKGLQHTNPNQIEIINSSTDTKLKPLEKRISASRFNSSSLEIYENWFKSLQFDYAKNVFRVSKDYSFSNKLGFITDISFESFLEKIPADKTEQKCFISEKNFKIDLNKLKKSISEISETEEWKKEFFTAEYLTYQKEADEIRKKEVYDSILEKNEKLVSKVLRILK